MLWQCSDASNPLAVSIKSIDGGGDRSSCQPGTPGNPTEAEAITIVIIAFRAPVHTTVTSDVVVVVVT